MDYEEYVDHLRREWEAQPKEIPPSHWASVFPEFKDDANSLLVEKTTQKKEIENKIIELLSEVSDKDEDTQMWREAFIESTLALDILKMESEIRWLKRYLAPFQVETRQITEEMIEQAKDVPIESFISTRLRKVGNRLTTTCPFHEEKTGSFTIFIDKNHYHCFGCLAHGSVIDFVMRQQSLDFIPAVKYLLKLQ